MKMTDHPLHALWHNIKHRCYNPNYKSYEYYGARGIDIYKPWLDSFWSFALDVEEEIGLSPGPGMHFDRRDNLRGYYPGNIQWTTPKNNSRTRQSNHKISYQGITKTISEWSEDRSINPRTLWSRLNDKGWSIEEALEFTNRHKN